MPSPQHSASSGDAQAAITHSGLARSSSDQSVRHRSHNYSIPSCHQSARCRLTTTTSHPHRHNAQPLHLSTISHQCLGTIQISLRTLLWPSVLRPEGMTRTPTCSHHLKTSAQMVLAPSQPSPQRLSQHLRLSQHKPLYPTVVLALRTLRPSNSA